MCVYERGGRGRGKGREGEREEKMFSVIGETKFQMIIPFMQDWGFSAQRILSLRGLKALLITLTPTSVQNNSFTSTSTMCLEVNISTVE